MGFKGSVVVAVKPKINEEFPSGEIIHLKFASVELDSNDQQKKFIECDAQIRHDESGKEYKKYVGEIEVPEGFGEIGAVIVELEDQVNERFIDTISIADQTPGNLVTFSCKSWVQPKGLIDHRRIFFFSKSYLSGRTPAGLVKLRAEDLANLRGEKADGTVDKNERKAFERIYDYDVYNDLGDPDKSTDLKRPVLGGSEEYPYPRRCRTGRPYCRTDPSSEQRIKEKFYVPRDEEFSEVKQRYFPPDNDEDQSKQLLGKTPFSDLPQIESMFSDGIKISSPASNSSDVPSTILQFPPPESYKRDRFNWLSDSEFARQTLAGLNPYSIQLVKSLPFISELDTAKYGRKESDFTPELVQQLLKSYSITVDEAIAKKKLFVVDYHDTLMEYVIKVRKINGTTLYGSRTLFFLKPNETLTPLGIELSRPPMDGNLEWKQVFLPSTEATEVWLWRLAKAHVLSHDSCIHQLVVHWLRTHCCMEPYAIATNRQLSTMHPIYRLLHPHFRYNLRMNGKSREKLINAGGIIESGFSTAFHSVEVSSSLYKKEWRFDKQALLEDLICRGMAERKEGAAHGVELTIKDYPFANDALILWDGLLKWVTTYINHYYGDDVNEVTNDKELQDWWEEIQEKGHPDKKEGWPQLITRDDLIKIVSTIAWVGSGHHSAVNFIQYAYAGYTPNRPSIARTNIPTEDSHQLPENFINQPEKTLLDVFPSIAQAYTVTKTLIVLSAHSKDEEYIGDDIEPAWALDPSIRIAFEEFKAKLKDLEEHIDKSNKDTQLKNRHGAGVMPYEGLKPRSTPGITGRGVPYSVST